MKKQGDLYLKIVSIVLAGIVVAYLVLSVLSVSYTHLTLPTKRIV